MMLSSGARAQIGGFTAANGPFMLEDAEDRDTIAGGVQRAWVPDNTGVDPPLEGVDPLDTTYSLTLAPGQSSGGCLKFGAKSKFDFINHSFGVPMPSVAGASTLTNPGNITSFDTLSFVASTTPTLTTPVFQVILECYPDNVGVYPKIYWNYSLSAGGTFEPVSINLRSPSLITNNPSSFTVEQLLAQTRYLAFYFYSGPEDDKQTMRFFVDDIQLRSNSSSASDWTLFH